jgi:hypothetical protein
VRDYVARFRAQTLLLGTEVSAETQVHVFVTNLSDDTTLRPKVQEIEEAITAAVGAEDRRTHNAGPDAKRARTTAHSAPTQAALALTAAPPQPAFQMPPPQPYAYPMMGPYMPDAPMHHIQTPLPPPTPGTWQFTPPAPVAAPVAAAPPPPTPTSSNTNKQHSGFKRNGVQKPRHNNHRNNGNRQRPHRVPPPNPAPNHGSVHDRVAALYSHVETYRQAILTANACLRCGAMVGEHSTHHTLPHCDGTGPFFQALGLSHGDVPSTVDHLPPSFNLPSRNAQ